MARAKQTNRADARRRYRQTVAGVEDGEAQDVSTASPTSPSGSKPGARGASTSTGKPGLTAAFRNAYQAPHYRDDLRALPELLLGKWFLIGVAITALGFLLYVALPNGVTALVWSVVSLPIGGPTLPIFLVGFTAPRASYLLGPALGIVNLIVAALVLALMPQLNTGSGSVVDVIVQGALYGLPTAVLFASGAAWYHRFLNLSNPRFGLGRSSQRGGRSKSAQKAAARR